MSRPEWVERIDKRLTAITPSQKALAGAVPRALIRETSSVHLLLYDMPNLLAYTDALRGALERAMVHVPEGTCMMRQCRDALAWTPREEGGDGR
jgi:hypothetical protein